MVGYRIENSNMMSYDGVKRWKIAEGNIEVTACSILGQNRKIFFSNQFYNNYFQNEINYEIGNIW